MAVDVVVDRFNFFIVFLCCDVYIKVSVYTLGYKWSSYVSRSSLLKGMALMTISNILVWLVSLPLVSGSSFHLL